MSPTRPEVARNATRLSPSSRTRTGAPSASGSSAETSAGIQYSRSSAPIGLPGPTRQSSSLSSPESMARLLRSVTPALLVEPDLLVEHLELGLVIVVLHPRLRHLVEGRAGDGVPVELVGAVLLELLRNGLALGGIQLLGVARVVVVDPAIEVARAVPACRAGRQ